jgi:CheY-like chemotaxis protein
MTLRCRNTGTFQRLRRCGNEGLTRVMLILLVEDEPLAALSATWELESTRHSVLGPAASSDEALQLVQRRRPDLALVDIDLERPNAGIDLVRGLRALDIPSLFVTAQATVAKQHADLVLGFIAKPYDPADLTRSVDVVGSMLEGNGPPQWLPRSLRLFALVT